MDMWKGSTPTLAFKFPFKTNTINALTFKCKQGDSVKISKALSDFSTSGENILYILLTQADTLALISEEYVTIQFKVQFTNNHVLPSSKMILPVQDVIDTVAMDGTATAEAPTFAVDVPFPTIDGSFSVVMGMAVVGGASSVAWTDITGKPETFPPSSHTHSKSQITDFPNIPTKTSDLTNDGDGTNPFLTSVDWTAILNKPQTFTPSSHNHDDRYYTESETDSKLLAKANQSTLDNTDRRVDALYEMWEGQMYDIDTRTATCYSADVPTGAFCDNVLKIGGKSIVMNQLVGSSTTTVILVNGHKYFTDISGTESIQTGSGNSVSVTGGTDMVIDLTKMFGSGNEPTTVSQFKAMFTKDYYAYNTGEVIHAPVKSVVVKDDENVVTSTTNIPQAIQSLAGYGWSAGTVCNEVDYANKKYIRRVARVDLGSLTWTYQADYARMRATATNNAYWSHDLTTYNNLICQMYRSGNGYETNYSSAGSNYVNKTIATGGQSINYIYVADLSYSDANIFKNAMSGIYLYYELATQVETDISSLIDEGFLEALDVESGGTVTFVHDSDDNYRLPVPNTNEYFVSISNRYGGA